MFVTVDRDPTDTDESKRRSVGVVKEDEDSGYLHSSGYVLRERRIPGSPENFPFVGGD